MTGILRMILRMVKVCCILLMEAGSRVHSLKIVCMGKDLFFCG